MARLTQTELVRKTRTLTTNGQNPEVQDVISGVGYAPAALTTGAGYAETVVAGQAATQAEKAAQTRATRAENTARIAAQKEVTSFAETARVLFADDPPTLLALGLQTHYETVTDEETGETRQVAVRLSEATADVIAQWSLMFENAGHLDAAQQALLNGAGWMSTRLTAALARVTAYSDADIAQQAAVQSYQARSDQHKADVETLRKWYAKASQLCKIAIRDADPTNSKQLLELLGLV